MISLPLNTWIIFLEDDATSLEDDTTSLEISLEDDTTSLELRQKLCSVLVVVGIIFSPLSYFIRCGGNHNHNHNCGRCHQVRAAVYEICVQLQFLSQPYMLICFKHLIYAYIITLLLKLTPNLEYKT